MLLYQRNPVLRYPRSVCAACGRAAPLLPSPRIALEGPQDSFSRTLSVVIANVGYQRLAVSRYGNVITISPIEAGHRPSHAPREGYLPESRREAPSIALSK